MMSPHEDRKQDQCHDAADLTMKLDSIIGPDDGDASSSPPSGKEKSFSGKASSSLPLKRRVFMNEDEKQEHKRATNRRSALESRLRRKQLIEDLQTAIADLSSEKAAMRQEIASVRLQLDAALAENRQLRFSSMLMQQQMQQQQQLGFAAQALSMKAAPMLQPAGILPIAGYPSLVALLPSITLAIGASSSNARQLLLQGTSKTNDDVISRVLAMNNDGAGVANQEVMKVSPTSPT